MMHICVIIEKRGKQPTKRKKMGRMRNPCPTTAEKSAGTAVSAEGAQGQLRGPLGAASAVLTTYRAAQGNSVTENGNASRYK